MQDIIFKKSKIHGEGIFAARNFGRGEIVIRWHAHPSISARAIERLPRKEQLFIAHINRKYIRVPPEGRLNHSCDPNVRLNNFCYIAKRKIMKGEELTTDYRAETDTTFRMVCRCGAKECMSVVKKRV